MLLKGELIGTPVAAVGASATTLTLRLGHTVESLMRDYLGGQAPLSDNSRVAVPGESTALVRPIELRACTLRLDPLDRLGPPA